MSTAPPLTGSSVASAIDPTLWAVKLDFDKKVERSIGPGEIQAALAAGEFVWIDVDVQNVEASRKVLAELSLIEPEIVEDALTRDPATQLARYDGYLHMVLSGCRLAGEKFDLERVDAVISEGFLLTLHKGQPVFLEAVRRAYRADFQRFAKSASFLVYELWDCLIDNYLGVEKRFEKRVDKLQRELMGDVDDGVFERVSDLTSDLLELRSVVLPARGVLSELSQRKTIFITEATQQFLANMLGTVERVLQDILVARDILSGSLNLYMSMVGHRTNRVMNRLTVVSVIFLPLTFLCGVYGMNFDVLPEKDWTYGYLYFWIAVVAIAVALLWVLRRARLL